MTRVRRTKVQVETIERQIIDVLRIDHPQTVRNIYYQLVNPRLAEPIPKTAAGYGVVQHRLVVMRRSGVIPYSWIADSTRRGYHIATYSGPADIIRHAAAFYRADLWSTSETYVEVWVESRSLAGVLHGVCEELAVSLYPSGGFSSLSQTYEAALQINSAVIHGRKKRAMVIYVGDYDPAGVLIDRDIESKLRQHLDVRVDLEFNRIAINEYQIKLLDLPTLPRKTTDRRRLDISHTVEAEAMPTHILKALLRDKVESFLPAGALAAAKAAEDSEREGLNALAAVLSGQHDKHDLRNLLARK